MKVLILEQNIQRINPFTLASKSEGITDHKIKLSIDDLTDQQIRRIRDRSVRIEVAPLMPITLIEPFSSNDFDWKVEVENKCSWGVRVTGAHQSPYSGNGITIAVLDTGIKRQHLAFKDVEIIERDFTGDGNGDENGHGTHCAGTIFGRSHRSLGDGLRFGVATGVSKVVIGKVIGKNNSTTDMIARAITWALDQGAHIISMSLGLNFSKYAIELENHGFPRQLAISKALEDYHANIKLFDRLASYINTKNEFGFGNAPILIAASGNESQRDKNPIYKIGVLPPAASDGFLSVAALGMKDDNTKSFQIAPFSNRGAKISAPGVDILSANYLGGLSVKSGTSMATPHVAGIAALWAEKQIQEEGIFNSELIIEKLRETAMKMKGLDVDDVGRGLVQAPQ